MQPTAKHPAASERERRASVEALRATLSQLLSADRRLRSRDHNRTGELTFAQIRSIAALGREREMTAWQLMWEERLAGFSDEELATAGRVLGALTEMLDEIPKRAASGHTDAIAQEPA